MKQGLNTKIFLMVLLRASRLPRLPSQPTDC